MFIINKDLRYRCTATGTATHGLPQCAAHRHINLFKTDVFGLQKPDSTAAIGTHYRCINFYFCHNTTRMIRGAAYTCSSDHATADPPSYYYQTVWSYSIIH